VKKQVALADDTEDRLKRLEAAVGTLISWIAQSANSPLSHNEAAKLLEILKRK